ncbi:MAG: hypothetical protein TRG1_1411 [Flavobacteriaceae bacterium FS1-H7996/R]|nr:MAG: hypothetical protein TRG1_1411 [Flavobacteriaceae bacterium FS1-H7996/R]
MVSKVALKITQSIKLSICILKGLHNEIKDYKIDGIRY